MMISPCILLRRKSFFFRQNFRENQNTHFMFSNVFPENRAFCEIMWKYMLEPDRSQLTIQYGAGAFHADNEGYKTHGQNM